MQNKKNKAFKFVTIDNNFIFAPHSGNDTSWRGSSVG